MTSDKPRRLGRGLEALLTPLSTPTADPGQSGTAEPGLQRLPIALIRPNPHQPRKEFRTEELAELEASMKESGLLQPVTVRPAPAGSGYELVAGERRLRAATRLGWSEIAALVRPLDDRALLTLALVENLQRTDLNPIEEAEGYRQLIEEFTLTQQQVADAVGKDRSTIANMLRVLTLPASVRRMVQDAQLSLGHARALLALNDERAITDLARQTAELGWSVREVERRVADAPVVKQQRANTAPKSREATPEVRGIEERLRRYLQTDIRVALSGSARGDIRISFYSADDMDRLLELIIGAADQTS